VDGFRLSEIVVDGLFEPSLWLGSMERKHNCEYSLESVDI
jgi:hypothetical protein